MSAFERRTLLGSLTALALSPLAMGRGFLAQLFQKHEEAPRPQVNPPSQSVQRRG